MSNYQLYHGDCLDMLPMLEAQSVDAVICDPPYGTTACKWDSVIPFEPMWRELKRVIKPRGAIVLFGSQPFTSALVMSNPKWFKEELIWEKDSPSNFAAAKYVTLKYHENMIVFAKDRYTYNPIMRDVGKRSNRSGKSIRSMVGVHGHMGFDKTTENHNRTDRYPSTVLHISRPKHNSGGALHPTQKPLALLEYLVRTYTNEGDTVLDFTMGSGTTGHACGNLDRNFVGIELYPLLDRPTHPKLNPNYFPLASARIASAYTPLASMQVAS